MPRFRTSSSYGPEYHRGRHRFEHWYRDNTVYFITARCSGRFPAFASERSKQVFWERFEHYTAEFGFVPWVATLIDNHYHTVGYLRIGDNLGQMMRRIHGSVAKLVNDTLSQRHVPFWRGRGEHDYFDGCLRDQVQYRRTYRYVLTQCRRHGICADYRLYPHTRVRVDLETGLNQALALRAFMEGVRYKRYDGEWE